MDNLTGEVIAVGVLASGSRMLDRASPDELFGWLPIPESAVYFADFVFRTIFLAPAVSFLAAKVLSAIQPSSGTARMLTVLSGQLMNIAIPCCILITVLSIIAIFRRVNV
jgi:hypothetical protein